MGDTVSIPDQQDEHQPRKPSPPPAEIPHKGEPLESPAPPHLISNPKDVKIASKKSKRCQECKKNGKRRKLTITNSLHCSNCDTKFCMDHISAHECDKDHHKHYRELLKKSNPVIAFKKVDKI